MRRDEAIAKLRTFEARFRALGTVSLFLFGSTARDEATDTSDLDLFMEVDPSSRFSLIDLVSAKLMVEDDLQTSVELATREGLHPLVRREIEREAIQIF